MRGFLEFLKTKGVMGLAVGFVLGSQVSSVVNSFVNNIVSPLLGLVLGSAGNLSEATFIVGEAEIMWGSFVNALINFLVISFIFYLVVKNLDFSSNNDKKK